MRLPKIFTLVVLVLVLAFGLFAVHFYQTGGAGLYRVIVHYLIPDLPDKRYNWSDFVYRGAGSEVSGFYSGGDEESFKMWTLNGLKTFYYKPGTSVFYFDDTCSAVKELISKGNETQLNQRYTYFDIASWEKQMQKEYFVTVKVLGKEDKRVVIDKLWAVSGRYKILGRIEEGVCE